MLFDGQLCLQNRPVLGELNPLPSGMFMTTHGAYSQFKYRCHMRLSWPATSVFVGARKPTQRRRVATRMRQGFELRVACELSLVVMRNDTSASNEVFI